MSNSDYENLGHRKNDCAFFSDSLRPALFVVKN